MFSSRSSSNWDTSCLCERAGRLKLTVLSEDRLQMKWREADGPVQGYKVRVRPISGENMRNFVPVCHRLKTKQTLCDITWRIFISLKLKYSVIYCNGKLI